MLTEQEVTLRPLNAKDKANLAFLANNKKVWINLRDYFPFPYTESDAEDFIISVSNQDPTMTFAIDYKDEFCGVISLVRQVDVYRMTAEIGYWLGEPFWNNGIATRAVALVTKYGFDKLGLIRIHAGIFEYNNGSMRVLEKCGYNRDGIFEKSVVKDGKIWNEHRYSIVTSYGH